jgi:GH25 family lysozyme M1 (1,4-beta-N-acetylmuramidase)
MRRLLGVVVAAALSVAVAPAASAEEEYPVVGGVVRDNVGNTHGPAMAAEFDGPAMRMAAADNVRGIDVASHQHPAGAAINWAQVASSGIRFTGVKATEGNYYLNPYYAGDMADAQNAGLYSFAYHFATPNDSNGVVQADYFLARANYTSNGRTLRPAVDLEKNPYDTANGCYDKTPAELVTWIRDYVNRIKVRTGIEPIIYTASSWWRDCVGGSSAFASYPLWVASYAETPSMPAGWTNWTLWQYSATTSVPGISGNVDGNYAHSEDDLAKLATKGSNPAGYTATAPTRVLDTRSAVGRPGTTPVPTRGTVTLDLSSRIPATATAAVLNVTAIAGSATFVTVWPSGAPRPISSNLNLVAGDIRPNLVTVQLGADRKVLLYNNYGNTHLIADLAGWYDTAGAGLYTALSPQRALDTRSTGPVTARNKITLNLSSRVPDTATAVTLNLTGVGATASTFVSAYPTGTTRSSASNLNLANASPTSNLVTVQLGANRSVDLYNHNGSVHLIADLAGYYGAGAGARFVALSPLRIIDTRVDTTAWSAVSGGGSAFPLSMTGPIPSGATAAVMNVTGVSPTLATYLATYPKTSATPTRPSTSNVQLARGQILPNLVSVALGTNRDVWMFNNSGSVNVIADLAGYFAP